MRRSYEPPRRWTWPHYRFVQCTLPRIIALLGGWRVEGVENVPDEGGAVIASNHLSHLDPPVVGSAMPRRTYYFAKSELFSSPVFGFIIRKCYAFPANRGAADTRALKNAIELLKAGELLTMFEARAASPGLGSSTRRRWRPPGGCADRALLSDGHERRSRAGRSSQAGKVAVSFRADRPRSSARSWAGGPSASPTRRRRSAP